MSGVRYNSAAKLNKITLLIKNMLKNFQFIEILMFALIKSDCLLLRKQNGMLRQGIFRNKNLFFTWSMIHLLLYY